MVMKQQIFIVLALTFWITLAGCRPSKVEELPDKGKHKAAFKVGLAKFHLIETLQGQPQWKLVARQARIKETNTELEGLKLQFFSKTQKTVLVIDAQQGNINRQTKQIEIQGQVKTTTQDGAVCITKNLKWQPERSRLTTPEKVDVVKDNLRLSGYGLEINPQDESVELKRDVEISQDTVLIKADRVTWDKKQGLITLYGNVLMTKGSITISAIQVNISGDLPKWKEAKAKGGVRVIDKGEGFCLEGEELLYNYERDYLLATNQPRLTLPAAQITALKMEAYLKEKRFVAGGQVSIQHKELKARASLATYYGQEKRIILSGSPEVTRDKSRLSGQEMIYYLETERLEVNKEVKATIFREKGLK